MAKHAKHIYQSFLVRCWLMPPTTADEPAAWRFELHEVSTESQKDRFSDFDQLTAFMAARLTAVTADNTRDKENERNRKGDKPNIHH